jgi:hypothetical protein
MSDEVKVPEVPLHCGGERCAVCGEQAVIKVAQIQEPEERWMHPLTWYVCQKHGDEMLAGGRFELEHVYRRRLPQAREQEGRG